MARSRSSPRYARLAELLVAAREAAGVTQVELARRLRRPQSFVSKVESGERRLDVVELLEITDRLGCRPETILAELLQVAE